VKAVCVCVCHSCIYRSDALSPSSFPLQVQRNKLVQYKKRLTNVMEAETKAAQQCMKQGKRKEAARLLKRRRMQQKNVRPQLFACVGMAQGSMLSLCVSLSICWLLCSISML
jgi:hypothetical protein